MRRGHRHPLPHGRRGFTLIEVLLAVGLATGLLLAALFFYRQAAQLRSDILQASRSIAALRLSLDQIAADLRAAVPVHPRDFVGGPASLEFTRFAPPPHSPASTNLSFNPPEAPIEVVQLSTLIQQDGTNLVVQGISRRSQPLGAPRSTTAASANVASTTPTQTTPPDSMDSNGPGPDAAPVETVPGTTNSPPQPAQAQAPLLPVRFLLFRYWNGTDWQDSWLASTPPQGVEVTLGLEPLPGDTPPEAFPHERFTRVVFIPAGQRPSPTPPANLPPSTPTEASP